MNARDLSLGDMVITKAPFTDDPTPFTVVEVMPNELKLFRVVITPGKIKGRNDKFVPFFSPDEQTVSRKAEIPFTIVRKGAKLPV